MTAPGRVRLVGILFMALASFVLVRPAQSDSCDGGGGEDTLVSCER